MTDPNYFTTGEHGPELVNLPPGSRVVQGSNFNWCECGHAEGVHWGIEAVPEFPDMEHPYRCHAFVRGGGECDCTEFRKRKPSRLRRFWNGKG